MVHPFVRIRNNSGSFVVFNPFSRTLSRPVFSLFYPRSYFHLAYMMPYITITSGNGSRFRMYAIWNALTKCDQFSTIYVDLNSHWIIDDRFNRYITLLYQNRNAYTHMMRIHNSHSWGVCLLACQFTNSWISFNLAILVSLCIEGKKMLGVRYCTNSEKAGARSFLSLLKWWRYFECCRSNIL